ncbi:MAG TPA: SDR family oxidoreductase [Burkholderiales bacterium]|nr:SDR family oxidoreductase [Burkholderiales bacterium]
MAIAVVIGADRGIARSVCLQLARRGDRVVAACLGDAPELRAAHIQVEPRVDVTSDAAVAGFAQRMLEQYARIDALYHVAGIMLLSEVGKGIEQLQVDDVRRQFEVNTLGPLRVIKALVPLLKAGSKVGIVTSRVGSLADNASGGQYGYRISKAAANMLGVNLHRELSDRGIAVVCLHPGMVATDLTKDFPGEFRYITPDQAAEGLIKQMDKLTVASAGVFRHANGGLLPW